MIIVKVEVHQLNNNAYYVTSVRGVSNDAIRIAVALKVERNLQPTWLEDGRETAIYNGSLAELPAKTCITIRPASTNL